MKMDLGQFAMVAAEFGGLKPSQAPGLAMLFAIVERAAFSDGVRWARRNSFALDSTEAYERHYASKTAATPDGEAATEVRASSEAETRTNQWPDGQYRGEAAAVAPKDLIE